MTNDENASKRGLILDKYPKKPKQLSYAMVGKEFGVSRQFVWIVYNQALPDNDSKLTPKQKGWAKTYLKTSNGLQSALEVYDTKSRATASTISVLNKKNPVIRAYMERVLEKAGFTDENISEYLRQIVEGGLKDAPKTTDALRAMEMVLRLKDRFPSQKIESISKVLNIDVNANVDDLLKQLKEVTDENQQLLSELSPDKKPKINVDTP